MSREEFLTKFWSPYPEMPEHAAWRGRLHFVDPLTGELRILQDGRVEETQLKILKDAPPSWPVAELALCLKTGDLVSVDRDGELTLLAPSRVEPALRSARRDTLQLWSRFQVEVKNHFLTAGFMEIQTPMLVPCPGTEPSLDVFQTEFRTGSTQKSLFLPTSPELHLKKALSSGFDEIFEIKNCFRNGEVTDHHQPEFTLLEWYRAWSSPRQIQDDAVKLVEKMAQVFLADDSRSPREVQRQSMAALFRIFLKEEITPQSTLRDYQRIAHRQEIHTSPADSIDDVFFRIFTEKIETHFHPDHLTIVEDWPPFQAALARLTDKGWADRFEIYWRGLELANAFHELNDPDAQAQRFEEDLAKKNRMNKQVIPLDQDFLRALQSGMPPAAGIALGLERLFMAMFGIKKIQELKLFPW